MQANFDLLNATRALIIKTIDGLSLEQVNFIPPNFNNNIAWNVAHILVTQQILHYKLSNLPMLVEEQMVAQFKKGTKAQVALTINEWQNVLDLLEQLPKKLKQDYEQGLFKNFTNYPTSYGYMLNNIEEAISFNTVHEALHLGYIMSMKKYL